MLDDRKTKILRAVVQEYIATGQPVGSGHVAKLPGVQVSSATVRNEMAVLEQEGYLAQPHTSAGRIPTDKGYRLFVDALAPDGSLDKAATVQVGEFFQASHGRLEELLRQTSHLLADITHHTALVVGPKAEVTTVRSIQVVRLSSRTATVVVVFSNGTVENEIIALSEEIDDAHLVRASAHLVAEIVGKSLADIQSVSLTNEAHTDIVCAVAVQSLQRHAGDEPVFVGGAASLAQSFEAVEVVRNVLQIVEQQYVVVSLLKDVLDRGLSVAIGAEHGVEPLAACSVVVAPVMADGEVMGSVGVLGPTRMNYPQALATVEVVGEQLGRRLSEGS